MTDREPWPLLAALDELLAREGWQDDLDAVMAIELCIADETAVGRLVDEYLDGLHAPLTIAQQVKDYTWRDTPAWKWPHLARSRGAPFLRSRDAAAMLEEAVGGTFEVRVDHMEGHVAAHSWSVNREWMLFNQAHEAAARTRAALEAGWRLGLWPVGGRP